VFSAVKILTSNKPQHYFDHKTILTIFFIIIKKTSMESLTDA